MIDRPPRPLPPMSAPGKRSVTIGGHRTSVSLEDGFWHELGRIARREGMTTAALIAAIDGVRPPQVGLATALRLYVLEDLRQMLAAQDRAD
ncbi:MULTISPECIES: ribbon-helix-helix domain-containing protein [unclassified Paracoccus (in: a-proteobacteria)]|uniref:ribbon-helix-helix domain-containing protein n=1 Tax=unclassified Paracoccus (in: a-proteobacteria) TaxID=2688777 RepID=UPI0012B2FC12|nr:MULTISPECIES: ribbon-helix-helix domain-containing protein [unclassified Paracoccus (in: a-proteobacteria)]UXU73984.1 ribbon-helix-helix domain-containing protein [Paracoccus sp. SMMA_5]UXU79872.1 ribbon-helix-helix domain-containing protein [Paracoccus sp. SMMA_5_TC]